MPLLIRDSSIRRRRKQSRCVNQTIKATERSDDRMQSIANGFAVANIERQRKCIFFAAECRDFSRYPLRCLKIAVGYHHMCAALRRLQCSFAPDPTSPANDDENLAAELFLRRLPPQFCFFQCPIFYAERFGRRQRDIVMFHIKRGVRSRGSSLRHASRRISAF